MDDAGTATLFPATTARSGRARPLERAAAAAVGRRLERIGRGRLDLTLPDGRRLPEIAELGFDERFLRMWEFYLATCAAAFAERKLGSLQIALARPGEDGAPPMEVTRCEH